MIRQAERRLAASGVDAPRLNAEKLLAHALGKDRAWLVAHAGESETDRLEPLLARRERREPLDYILGETPFAGIVVRCDRRALIPRPETEDLVTMAVEAVKGIPSPRIADIGTGTGAIALAIKAVRPEATLVATDLSPDALALARENGERLGLSVDFRLGKDLEPLRGERFDLIVGNPPYISETDYAGLMPEVRDWEPRMALVGGTEGTEVMAGWAESSPSRLKPGGRVMFEIGCAQGPEAASLLEKAGFQKVSVLEDFAGLPRFVSGSLQCWS